MHAGKGDELPEWIPDPIFPAVDESTNRGTLGPRVGVARAGGELLAAALAMLALAACGGHEPPPRVASDQVADTVAKGALATPPLSSYAVSPSGGTPATGPGDRFNSCERIWCLTHGENFSIEHFLVGHSGYVLHTPSRGDVFVPRHRTSGPEFPDAAPAALLLCGQHAHPWLFGRGGGRGAPIQHTGYNRALGYSRAHFQSYGTRLDPCCVNGLGSAFVHSSAGKQFRFHETAQYRSDPTLGWQKPFAARVTPR